MLGHQLSHSVDRCVLANRGFESPSKYGVSIIQRLKSLFTIPIVERQADFGPIPWQAAEISGGLFATETPICSNPTRQN